MERRSAVRSRAVLKAEIRYNDGLMNMPCLVRDISDTGARLEISADVPLPDRFDLYIEKRHLTRRAVVKRRRDREVGVAFADVADRQPPQPQQPDRQPLQADAGLARRVAKLESDLAEIRTLLEKLATALHNSKRPNGP